MPLYGHACSPARGAESWWGCSDSDSDSGLLVGSDSGPDTKYKINKTWIVERVSAIQAKKINVTFPIDFGLHSFGRKIFIQLSPMPDHLIRVDNGGMVVSRTFAWWSTCTICAVCISNKLSYCQSFYSHAVTITPTWAQLQPQLPNCISSWFGARHAKKCGAIRWGPPIRHWYQHGVVYMHLSLSL